MADHTFTWVPDDGVQVGTKYSGYEVKFGDGYTQDVGEGINDTVRTVTVTFARTYAEVLVIKAFLDARKSSGRFNWTPPGPGQAAGEFVCKAHTIASRSGENATLTATFEERF